MRHFTSFTYRYKYSIRNESFNCYNVVFRDALNLTDILYSSTLILHFNRKYLGYEINIYLANAYFCINSFICILILLMYAMKNKKKKSIFLQTFSWVIRSSFLLMWLKLINMSLQNLDFININTKLRHVQETKFL